MKKRPGWLRALGKRSQEALEVSSKIIDRTKEKVAKVDEQYQITESVKGTASGLGGKLSEARNQHQFDEKIQSSKQKVIDTYDRVLESETYKDLEAQVGKVVSEADRVVFAPLKSEFSQRGGSEKIDRITFAVASGYGLSRAYVKPYYAPDTPEELLLTTKEELLYINACILQVSRSEAEKLAQRLGKAVTSKLAGAAAAGGLLTLVSSFGAAGTGTAIASLSGAAANSATLAWVGSLFGGGMAAGAAVTGGLGVAVGIGVYALLGSEARRFEDLSEIEKRIVESTGLLIAAINQTLEDDSMRLSVDDAEVLLVNNLRPLHALIMENSAEISNHLDAKNKIAFEQHAVYDFERSVIDGFEYFIENEKTSRRVKYPAYAIAGVVYALLTQSVVDDSRESGLVLAALRRSKKDWENASEYELSQALAGYGPEELKGLMNSVKGIYHEMLFIDDYNSTHTDTYAVMHPSTNHPGSDVVIYLVETDEHLVSYQFKATDNEQSIREHFEKYPDIDVMATEELASQNLDNVESSGYSNEEITQDVYGVVEALSENSLADRVSESAGYAGLAAAGFEAIQVLRGKKELSAGAPEGLKGAFVAGTSTALVAYFFG